MKKKKILIYADDPDWAYDNIARTLRHWFKDEYDWYYDYTYCHRYSPKYNYPNGLKADVMNLLRFVSRLLTFRPLTNLSLKTLLNYKLTFFWQRRFIKNEIVYHRRVLPAYMKYDLVILLDYYFDRHAKLTFRTKKLIKGIYTEGFPPMGCSFDYKLNINPLEISSFDFFCDQYLAKIDALLVGCPSLINRYGGFVKDTYFCSAFRGEEKFVEKPIRLKNQNEVFVVGWTGNPNRNFKNFYTIVKPAIERLKEMKLNIVLKTQFKGTYESLYSFYGDVDIVLIASERDVGPSMFAEASLSGVPSISNNIGFPSYVIEDGINGYIVNLMIEGYIERILYLYNNRRVLFEMSLKVRQMYLDKVGSNILKNNWKIAFNSVGV